jgi:flavorubredoxin
MKKEACMQYVVVLVVGAAAAATYLFYRIGQEVVSEMQVLNADSGQAAALVVYHRGQTDFQEIVTHAFAEGLAAAGWRVEMTTASPQAPTDLSAYDLLVLGSPTYGPSQPISKHIKRLGDLGGKRTVILITGLGATDGAIANVRSLVEAANGSVIKAMPFWQSRPNNEQDPRPNREVALHMATQAAKAILPGQ